MKNILKLTTSIILCGLLLCTLSSFTDEDESGGGSCTLCVVKGYKKILGVWVGETVFSCKAAANQSCSKSGTNNDANGNPVTYSISCNNAVACSN
jgi:hypothetical protein